MLAGASGAVLSGSIGMNDAVRAVQPDVMLFLFGMFVVGEAVHASGFIGLVTGFISLRCRTPDQMLMLFIIIAGSASAFLMNDTVAIIGPSLALALAVRYRIPPEPLLLALCFALTTGSVVSPIGNPQNLLVASYWNRPDPFQLFFSGLIVPTLMSLALVFLWIRLRYQRGRFRHATGIPETVPPELPVSLPDPRLVFATRISLITLLIMTTVRIIAPSWGDFGNFPLSLIAIAAAAPILIISRERFRILQGVDWRTLLFFASLFVLMQSVYDSGWFQETVPFSTLTSPGMIFTLGILLSQFISNVPFVALFQPVIFSSGMSAEGFLALAAGSTIAGNLTILGAASNVIVLQQAEKHGVRISFPEFLREGMPLTIMQSLVYISWFFLT